MFEFARYTDAALFARKSFTETHFPRELVSAHAGNPRVCAFVAAYQYVLSFGQLSQSFVSAHCFLCGRCYIPRML